MLCSYLIQEQHYSVAEALHHFELARPPRGIRYGFYPHMVSVVIFDTGINALVPDNHPFFFLRHLSLISLDTTTSKANFSSAMNLQSNLSLLSHLRDTRDKEPLV